MARSYSFQMFVYWSQRASQAQSEEEKKECQKRAEQARSDYMEWTE